MTDKNAQVDRFRSHRWIESSASEETCSSRCAVACIDISLPDFGNDTVLQIYDIGVLKSELE